MKLKKLKYITEFFRLFIGIPTACLSTSLYAVAIYRELHPSAGPYLPIYFLASTPGSTVSVVNYSTRICDQSNKSRNLKNQISGGGAIVVTLIQSGLSAGVYSGRLTLPPVFSVLMSTLAMFFSEGLNWKSRKAWGESYVRNKPRYFGFGAGIITVTMAAISWANPGKEYYFFTSAAFDSFVMLGIWGRKYDIDHSNNVEEEEIPDELDDQAEENGCNKKLIRLYLFCIGSMFLINLSYSGWKLISSTDFDLPVAVPNCVLVASSPFYLMAQANLSLVSKMCGYMGDKVVGACTKISASVKSCSRTVCDIFSKAISCCRKKTTVETSAETNQVSEPTQSANHFVRIIADTRSTRTSTAIDMKRHDDTLPDHHDSVLSGYGSVNDHSEAEYFLHSDNENQMNIHTVSTVFRPQVH